MSVSFLRMQWRSRTFVVSVFRCLVSLVCQCRAICCRLRSLKSTMRLSKSHLLGLVPGKKLGSELHAIRLFPFNGRLLSSQIFSRLSGQRRATWIMMMMMVVSFSRTTQEAWRTKRMSVRDQWAVWSMIDERWSMMPGHVSVSRSVVDRRHFHPSTLPLLMTSNNTRDIHRFLTDNRINGINYINLIVNSRFCAASVELAIA